LRFPQGTSPTRSLGGEPGAVAVEEGLPRGPGAARGPVATGLPLEVVEERVETEAIARRTEARQDANRDIRHQ